jgi:hypothetical protein
MPTIGLSGACLLWIEDLFVLVNSSCGPTDAIYYQNYSNDSSCRAESICENLTFEPNECQLDDFSPFQAQCNPAPVPVSTLTETVAAPRNRQCGSGSQEQYCIRIAVHFLPRARPDACPDDVTVINKLLFLPLVGTDPTVLL